MSKETIELLNNAFLADKNAIHALMTNKVPCNSELADDPYIIVSTVPVLGNPYGQVSCLGLINGIMAANKLPLVAMKFSNPDEDGKSNLLGFCAYEYGIEGNMH
jgi:hypothetical protein